MESVYGEILPLAVAIALSPMPVVGLLLILLSKKSRVNSVLYALGWVVGLLVLVIVASYFITNGGHSGTSFLSIGLGVLLLVFGIREWVSRPKKGQGVKMPGWMRAVEGMSPFKAFGLGFLFATVNFKNTPLGVAVAGVLSGSGGLSSQLSGLMFYLLVASFTVVVPVVLYLFLGNRLLGMFGKLKKWLVLHNNVILSILFVLLGIFMIVKST